MASGPERLVLGPSYDVGGFRLFSGCLGVIACSTAAVVRGFFRGGSFSSFIVEVLFRAFGTGAFEDEALRVRLGLASPLMSEPLQRLSSGYKGITYLLDPPESSLASQTAEVSLHVPP